MSASQENMVARDSGDISVMAMPPDLPVASVQIMRALPSIRRAGSTVMPKRSSSPTVTRFIK
jgi:hypothetical protein